MIWKASLGDLPDPGLEPGSLVLQEDSLLSEPLGKTRYLEIWETQNNLFI